MASDWLAGAMPKRLICHCLLIEAPSRFILVDTGIGRREIENQKRLGPLAKIIGVENGFEHTAEAQVRAAGFSPADVTDIIVTHLDMDHAGGLPDFPNAKVHVSEAELSEVRHPRHFQSRIRYRALDFVGTVDWATYAPRQGEAWKGFACVRDLDGLPPEILLVNLPGHTAGHFGVAVQENKGWWLHAGDAYYDRQALEESAAPSVAVRMVGKMLNLNYGRAMLTMARLSELAKRDPDVRVFCSHDPSEFEAPAVKRELHLEL
jgi:glyoxylase-like metal-dependent hydrolase (beta-lactamase superfamily II)